MFIAESQTSNENSVGVACFYVVSIAMLQIVIIFLTFHSYGVRKILRIHGYNHFTPTGLKSNVP
jgi:hypothetical protein